MRAMLFAGHTCGNRDTPIGRSSRQFGGHEVAGAKQLLSESVIGVEAVVVNHPNEIEATGPCVHQESVFYGRDCSPIETGGASLGQDSYLQNKDAAHGHVLQEEWQTTLVAEAKVRGHVCHESIIGAMNRCRANAHSSPLRGKGRVMQF